MTLSTKDCTRAKPKRVTIARCRSADLAYFASSGPPIQRKTFEQCIASYASRRSYLVMLSRESHALQRVRAGDPAGDTVFDVEELPRVRNLHELVKSDLDFVPPLKVVQEVLRHLIRDMCHSMNVGVAKVTAIINIGTEVAEDLCELIAAHGPIPRKVMAIDILRVVYAYVAATTQAQIAAALEGAIQRTPKSKRIAKAVASARRKIREMTFIPIGEQATVERERIQTELLQTTVA